jgi:hypothetical protein
MSSHEEHTLIIKPRLSKRLLLFVLGTHLAALLLLPLVPLPLPVLTILATVILGSGYHLLSGDVLRRSDGAVIEARLEADDGWRLVDAKGREWKSRLRGDSYYSSRWIILNFDSGGWFSPHRMILSDDAIDGQLLRRLRVRLRSGSTNPDKGRSYPGSSP